MRIRDRLKTLEDSAINAATTTALATKADKTDLTALAKTVSDNKAAADAIKATADKATNDITALTQRMVTAEDLLGKRKAVRLNRSPSNTDQYELGTVWEDVSFSEAYPLRFISIGDGVWQYLNEIKLRAIRVFVTSTNASFPQCRNIRFVDKNGVTIPYNNWVVGARSAGFYAPAQGSIYTGGGSQEPPSKTTGWFELEPASGFDYTRGIKEGWASLRADTASTSLAKIELHFNSGAIKSITSTLVNFSGDKQFVALPQPEAFQYGSSVAALMGEQLTSGKLADANSNDYGRISGAALNAAIQQIISPTAKSPSQADFESLVNRIAQLESRLP